MPAVTKTGAEKCFYWVTTRLVRESGPWYVSSEGICSPQNVYRMMQEHFDLENCDREHFICLYLDRKGHVNAANVVSVGGLSSSIVHAREVFKVAILGSAASVILVHNHPSGDPTPSREDIDITRRMKEAGDLLGIEVLDHVIVGATGCYASLTEMGLM
ncbi:RadC-like JAB domain [Syntrophomonas zehnderi OL-4]|uniref:RadC-like JAB domain n=2 Tax=Syntrophomonas TaxID=862 RepID=A0A0E4G9I7_9FIRM|nr:RadC-like JAB domain [Syntrophomonas zehnderi OL-4]